MALRILCLQKNNNKKNNIPHSVRLLCRLLNVFVPCALIKYAFIKFKDMWMCFSVEIRWFSRFHINSIRKVY